MHTYIHTYIHTHLHVYIHINLQDVRGNKQLSVETNKLSVGTKSCPWERPIVRGNEQDVRRNKELSVGTNEMFVETNKIFVGTNNCPWERTSKIFISVMSPEGLRNNTL